jgi:transcriptional regulator with XRE-family HTH domain
MESPQPLMRAVARFALLQGWTQEELANRLGQSGSNLTRRFTGSGTRLTTMRRFARELGFPDQYVNLMLGEDIDSAELKAAKHLLDLELRYAEHEFAPTVQHDVQLLLSRMRSDRLESVLRSFLIAQQRVN